MQRFKRSHQHEPCLTLISNYAQQIIRKLKELV